MIVPVGIATDDTTKVFFSSLVNNNRLVNLCGFENEAFIFPTVHHAFKFCTLTVGGPKIQVDKPDYVFFCRSIAHARDPQRHFKLDASSIALINPNTCTCPIFRTETDAKIIKAIYERVPVFMNNREQESQNPWGVNFSRMFDMTNDSHLFRFKDQLLSEGYQRHGSRFNSPSRIWIPLYEGKMIDFYDARNASIRINPLNKIRPAQIALSGIDDHRNPSFLPSPNNWISFSEVIARIPDHWDKKWFGCFMRVTAATNYRTVVGAFIPFSGLSSTLISILPRIENVLVIPCLFGNIWSIVFDYVVRTKTSQPSLPQFVIEQSPVIPPDRYTPDDLAFIVPRVLELTYTAWDIKAFADDVWRDADDAMRGRLRAQWEANAEVTSGHPFEPPEWAEIAVDGCPLAPFAWDEERRAVLRAELDALYARLYGLTRDELRYILDPADVYGEEFPGETFRVLKEKEIRKYGEYRTRRLVLEAWDRMGNNIREGGGLG